MTEMFDDGDVGVISQGIFETSFSDASAYVEKRGVGDLEKNAHRFRQFVGYCHGWPTETSLRAYLSACKYKTRQESSVTQMMITTIPAKLSSPTTLHQTDSPNVDSE